MMKLNCHPFSIEKELNTRLRSPASWGSCTRGANLEPRRTGGGRGLYPGFTVLERVRRSGQLLAFQTQESDQRGCHIYDLSNIMWSSRRRKHRGRGGEIGRAGSHFTSQIFLSLKSIGYLFSSSYRWRS